MEYFPGRTSMEIKNKTMNLKIFKIESSSRQCSMISEDSLLEAKMDDKQFSSHLSIRYLINEPGEILTSDDHTKPRMEHYRSKWRLSQDDQSTRQRITFLADTVECHRCFQFCATRMRLQGDFSKWVQKQQQQQQQYDTSGSARQETVAE